MQAGRSPFGKAGFHFRPDFSWQTRPKLKFDPSPPGRCCPQVPALFLENSPHP